MALWNFQNYSTILSVGQFQLASPMTHTDKGLPKLEKVLQRALFKAVLPCFYHLSPICQYIKYVALAHSFSFAPSFQNRRLVLVPPWRVMKFRNEIIRQDHHSGYSVNRQPETPVSEEMKKIILYFFLTIFEGVASGDHIFNIWRAMLESKWPSFPEWNLN